MDDRHAGKSTLSAAHLIRQYFLFVLTVVFLLTLVRAVYALWKFVELEQTGAFVPLFVQGLRFDLALVGIVCLVPVVVGSLLSMLSITRLLAKFVIALFLFTGLLAVLVLEFLTPWFVHTQGVRPDIPGLLALEAPLDQLQTVLGTYPIHAAVGGILCVLILVAFWVRMELPRFLRYRTSVPAATLTALLGGALCLLAIWSTPDIRKPALGPGDALISTNSTINDLAMNTTYKSLHSLLLPFFNDTL